MSGHGSASNRCLLNPQSGHQDCLGLRSGRLRSARLAQEAEDAAGCLAKNLSKVRAVGSRLAARFSVMLDLAGVSMTNISENQYNRNRRLAGIFTPYAQK